jgi:hypothetical protein
MGHYTNFTLRIINRSDEKELLCLHENSETAKYCSECGIPISLKYLSVNDFIEKLADDIGYDPFGDECKWYDHEEEMYRFSKEYPNVVFELSGKGEKNHDLWKKYFKNGKMQMSEAIITYEPFDESKLIDPPRPDKFFIWRK